MNEIDDLRLQNEALHQRCAELLQRALDAEQAFEAFARGEVDAIALDISSTPVLLHAAQADLRRSEQLLRAIFDGALDAMLLTDEQGRYVDANPAACALFQRPRDQLLGIRSDEVTGAVTAPATVTAAAPGPTHGHFTLERADGPRRIDYRSVSDVALGLDLTVLRDITDQVEAEEALRHNEALFRALIEKSAEVMSLTTAGGTTRYLTPLAWRMLGWTVEELGTHTLRDQVVPEDRRRVTEAFANLARNGARDISLEFQVRHRDGSLRWIEATATNLLGDPDVRAIVGNYRDITDRKEAEQALRKGRDLLEEAQAIAHVGSWTSGIGPSEEVTWSRECYRIFGLPEGIAMTVESFMSCVHPADLERLAAASREATERGTPFDIEHRVQRPDGSACWVHERAVVERDATGRPIRLVGTVQDITDRHAALDELQASEQRYRRIVENTSEGVWTYDARGVTTFMNLRLATMLGYALEEVIGRPSYSFLTETNVIDDRTGFARRQGEIAERVETELRRKDGSSLWTSIQVNPLFDEGGAFEGALALVTDVSGQRLAAEARARLAAIVDSSEDAILSANLDGTITSWNRAAETLYQYPASEMVGQSMLLLASDEMVNSERQLLESAGGGTAVHQYETTRRRKDGSEVEVAITVSPVRDAAGAVIGVSKITRDLPVRRRAEARLRQTEEQFRQAQKMEAVGRLAGGVAHDFNNLLSVILSFARFALDDVEPGSPMHGDIEQIEHAATRAATLTRQLLAFSRQQVLQPRVVDLNDIISGMKAMLGPLLGEDVELLTHEGGNLGRVLADEGQIEQVVMNLAVNARDAMPEGGQLTLETGNVTLDAADVGTHLGVLPGHYVRIAISDTGCGMDEATKARVFEPFFTTKERGKGTGLGLSTVFGIVKQSGGHIDLSSEPGKGCTFEIYLPRTDLVASAAITSSSIGALTGSETILLVEDEAQVRAAAGAILRRNGYNVLETSSGSEALAVSRKLSGKIHLLVTDVVMPGQSGRKLAEELAPLRPTMRILFVSGYTDDAIVHHGVLEAGLAFLQKPFTPETLSRKVREVLDAVEAPGPAPVSLLAKSS